MSTGMILEKIKSDGLAHLSYIIGHQGQAAVIDPRRDCSIYVEKAYQQGMRIEYIFETHRNEDYVIGSRDLSRMTGARIYHGSHLDFHYGHPAREGDIFELGDLRLKILETPGHTFESLSLAVMDKRFGDNVVAVFTGDALFVGDVGRTDFFGPGRKDGGNAVRFSIRQTLAPGGSGYFAACTWRRFSMWRQYG